MHAFVVRGEVERGDQRGRTLGFPTANLSIAGHTVDDGVYAGWLDRAAGERLAAAVSVGGRPTFYGPRGYRLLEAHVLDFDGDLYGEVVTVWLGHRIRGQRRFPSVEALVEQLHRDVAATRDWCAATSWSPTLDASAAVPLASPIRIVV